MSSACGCESSSVSQPDFRLFRELANVAASRMQGDVAGTWYQFGTPWELLYSVDGDTDGWMYGELGAVGVTYELNADNNENGVSDAMFKFSRAAVEQILPEGDDVEVTMYLEVTNTMWFVARDLLPEDLEEILRDPRLRRGLVEAPKKNTYFVLFNCRGGSAPPALRRALAGTVRPRDLVWRTLGRFAEPATSLIPPAMVGHDPGRRSAALPSSSSSKRTSTVRLSTAATGSVFPWVWRRTVQPISRSGQPAGNHGPQWPMARSVPLRQ